MAAEPEWLRIAGQVAGVVLIIELWVVLLIVCALMIGFWLGARWVRMHLVPIVEQYGEQARGALETAVRGGDRIVEGVAELRGRQVAVRAAIATFLLGPGHGYRADGQQPAALPAPTAALHPARQYSAHHRGDGDDVIERFELRDDADGAAR
jgi:hypothetical protein